MEQIDTSEIAQLVEQSQQDATPLIERLPADGYCPENREQCNGMVIPGASDATPCPLDAEGKCPYADQRRQYHQRRTLQAAGFGRRYVECDYSWALVYDPVEPVIREYCDCIDEKLARGEALVLGGPTEAGKTCCLAMIALAAPEGATVQYATMAGINRLIFRDQQEADRLVMSPDLLLLDEFGAAYSDKHSRAIRALDDYISYRDAEMLSTCIATNMATATMQEEIDAQSRGAAARIFSRLSRTHEFVSFAGAPKLRQRAKSADGFAENDSEAESMHRQEVERL